MSEPAWPGYFADPFVLRVRDEYFAFGTGNTHEEGVFGVLGSPDLRQWQSLGSALVRLDPSVGDEYWAPEVVQANGAFWMYYSAGHGIRGHHIRVARAAEAAGPYVDLGLNLTPDELFAIDPHPFQDIDGTWYLYYARDVLDDPRPGTHLAVDKLVSMIALAGAASVVLAPNDDWQIYARDRAMYDGIHNWHTLEGPTVVYRHGAYWLTFSGGSWEGSGYGVSWARASTPRGPWEHAPTGTARLLQSSAEFIGPGHSSVTTDKQGADVIAFHAWTPDQQRRVMHLRYVMFTENGPKLGPPL